MPSLDPTILAAVFASNQKRERLIESTLEGIDMPPEDYPFYVTIGVEGPYTPTELAENLSMPLSTVLFRVRRLEKRGHSERVPNPEDGRSYRIRLTPAGKRLLGRARPVFRARAKEVEARLGKREVAALRAALLRFRDAVDAVEQRPVGRKRALSGSR